MTDPVSSVFPYQKSLISDLSGLRFFLRSDLRAYNVPAWRFHYRLTKPGLYYQRIMRQVEFLEASGWVRVAKMRHAYLKLVSITTGISVPPGTFGPGLSIPHVGSIVVNDKVRFGAFCRIHSATNIGEYEGGAPRGGDGIYIGPGAVLYGDISVGSGVVVGANSVVNRDVEQNSVVAGSPARTIGEGGTVRSMPHWVVSALEVYRSNSNG